MIQRIFCFGWIIFFFLFNQPLAFASKDPCPECRKLIDPISFLSSAKEAYHLIQADENYSGAESLLRTKIDQYRNQLFQDSFIIHSIYYLLLPEVSEINKEYTDILIKELNHLDFRSVNEVYRSLLFYALSERFFYDKSSVQCYNSSIKINDISSFNPVINLLSLISISKANELAQDYKSVLRNFFNAIYVAESIGDPFYKNLVFYEIAMFYKRKNIFSKAYDYIVQMDHSLQIDSLNLFYQNLERYNFLKTIKPGWQLNLNEWYSAIQFANHHDYKRLRTYYFSFLRSYYLDLGSPVELLKIYQNDFPEELEKMKTQNEHLYDRLIAAFHESSGRLDSAEHYYQKALNLQSKNNLHIGYNYSLHIRYGDFLFRRGRSMDLAEHHYLKAFDAANSLGILEYQIATALKLHELQFYKYPNSLPLKYVEQYYTLKNRVDSVQHDRDMVNIEIVGNEELLKLQAKMEEAKKNSIYQSQYNLIAVGIFIIFLTLLLSAQMHVPVWFIRTLGFLSFIFLFEFLIIQLDKPLHAMAHDVPWKLFGIKVALFAMLMPLHHWIEKKVVHFLVDRRAKGGKIFSFDGFPFKNWFTKLNQPEN